VIELITVRQDQTKLVVTPIRHGTEEKIIPAKYVFAKLERLGRAEATRSGSVWEERLND